MQAKWMSPTKLLYSEPMALKSEFWSWNRKKISMNSDWFQQTAKFVQPNVKHLRASPSYSPLRCDYYQCRVPPMDPPLIIKNFDPSCHRGSSSSVIRSRTGKVVSSILTWSLEVFWAFLCLSLNYSVEKHRVYLCTKEKMMSLLWSLFSGNFVH